jgi:hypothetical protein
VRETVDTQYIVRSDQKLDALSVKHNMEDDFNINLFRDLEGTSVYEVVMCRNVRERETFNVEYAGESLE